MESFNNILLVSATEVEIRPLLDKLNQPVYFNSFIKEYYLSQNTNLDIIVTGVGIPFTIYRTMRIFSRIKYDLVINVGIAGSFNDNYAVGSIVNVVSDQFADLGIMEVDGFHSIFDKNLADFNEKPFTDGKLINSNNNKYPLIDKLPKVNGITVNTAHAISGCNELYTQKFNADIETMEGAAVFYVSMLEKTPFLGIRAISNKVDIRDKALWNMPLAIKNLNEFVYDLLKELTSV